MCSTDSLAHRTDVFDYDIETGEISLGRPFVEFEPNGGLPSGMTVQDVDHV